MIYLSPNKEVSFSWDFTCEKVHLSLLSAIVRLLLVIWERERRGGLDIPARVVTGVGPLRAGHGRASKTRHPVRKHGTKRLPCVLSFRYIRLWQSVQRMLQLSLPSPIYELTVSLASLLSSPCSSRRSHTQAI